MKCRDDDGRLTGHGDKIAFSYGIPPRRAEGSAVERDGVLWLIVPGHQPNAVKLRWLRRYVGSWWKKEGV